MADILDGQFKNTRWKAFVRLNTEPDPGEAIFPLETMVQTGYNPIHRYYYVKLRSGQEFRIDRAEHDELLFQLEEHPAEGDAGDERQE